MRNSNLMICNNTGANLSAVYDHILAFAHTGNVHDDIADLFELKLVEYPGSDRPFRVIVNFA